MSKTVTTKKKTEHSDSFSFSQRERDALIRRHRQCVFLNDREKLLIDEYCRKNKVKSRSALIRKIVIERLLTDLGENPPTLF